MDRRKALEWLSRTLAAACALVVAVPGVSLVIDPLRKRGAREAGFQRVARLSELSAGVPRQVAVVGSRRDAWTLYAQEVIGHAWLVRSTEASGGEKQAAGVEAYSTICPHLGCAIQLDAAKGRFVCPCHNGAFNYAGDPLKASELGRKNPVPRGMDSLECRVVQDEGSDESWVEVKYERFRYGLTEKVVKA